jgi:transcriptional regulator with XRE-family HTH domain
MPSTSPYAGSSDLVALGLAVRRLRELHAVQQEAVGYDAGLGKGYLSALELGRLNPGFMTLLTIVRTLGFSLVELTALHERELRRIDPHAGHDVPLCPTPEALVYVRGLNAAWAKSQERSKARRARGRIRPWT